MKNMVVFVVISILLFGCTVLVLEDDVLTVRKIKMCGKDNVKFEYTIKCDDVTAIRWQTNEEYSVGDTIAFSEIGQ